ncbi:hypothetical protein AGMMS49982_07930 [Bacteroidia bacterium]|nr:hypothetical protein AGMMS49982_07930 [Bacteroidia bacterium]
MRKTIRLTLLTGLCVSFFAGCVATEPLDFDQAMKKGVVSVDWAFEGNLLQSSGFTLDSLLAGKTGDNTEIKANEEGIITMYLKASDPQSFNMAEINSKFGAFSAGMENLKPAEMLPPNLDKVLDRFGTVPIPEGETLSDTTFIALDFREKDPVTGDLMTDTIKRIHHIDFKEVTITITLTIDELDIKTDTFLTMTLEFPQFNNPNPHIITMQVDPDDPTQESLGGRKIKFTESDARPFVMDCTDSIRAIFKITGDGQTSIEGSSEIAVGLEFAPHTYVTYGWFNLEMPEENTDINSEELLPDMSALQNSKLVLSDPKIRFAIVSTLGTPLEISLAPLAAYINDEQDPSVPLEIPYKFEVPPAEEGAGPTNINASLDKDSIADVGHKATFVRMISSNLDSLHVNFKLGTPPIDDFNNKTVDDLFDDPRYPIQSLASDAIFSLQPNIEMPFTLGPESRIVYADTIPDVGFEDLFGDSAYTIGVTLILDLKYTNELEIPLKVEIMGLDANNDSVAVWSFDMPATGGETWSLIADGNTKNKVGDKDDFIYQPLVLKKDGFGKAKSLLLRYDSGRFGVDRTLRAGAKVSLAVGMRAEITADIKLDNSNNKE